MYKPAGSLISNGSPRSRAWGRRDRSHGEPHHLAAGGFATTALAAEGGCEGGGSGEGGGGQGVAGARWEGGGGGCTGGEGGCGGEGARAAAVWVADWAGYRSGCGGARPRPRRDGRPAVRSLDATYCVLYGTNRAGIHPLGPFLIYEHVSYKNVEM